MFMTANSIQISRRRPQALDCLLDSTLRERTVRVALTAWRIALKIYDAKIRQVKCLSEHELRTSAKQPSAIRRTKRRIESLASKKLWTRYAMLAPYLGLQALIATFTRKTIAGSTHLENSVDEAVRYILRVFNDYKSLAGVKTFWGNVAEIGPGDSCGIGLLFLVDGCERVDLIDRFYSPRDETHQREINKCLLQYCPEFLRQYTGSEFSEDSF